MDLEIVQCRPEWLDELYAFRARVWTAEGAAPTAFPQGVWYDPLDDTRLHWVVIDEGRIVAGASLGFHDSLAEVEEAEAYTSVPTPPPGIVASPVRVVVDAAYRSRGLASRLLTTQDETSRDAGAVISVRQASPAMARLLTRLGWRDHGPAPADPRFPNTTFDVMSILMNEGA